MLPPKTASDALDMCYAMESYYREAMDGFEEDDLFYEGLLDEVFSPPDGYNITIPTTARAVVDEAVDASVPADILVGYAPRGLTQIAEKDADLVRQAVRSMWKYWRTHGSDIDILRDFMKNLFKSGKACFKLVPDWSLWPSLSPEVEAALMETKGKDGVLDRAKAIERMRSENFPLVCRSISPRCIMESPHVGTRKLWAIERYESTFEEVRDTYALEDENLRDYYYLQTSFQVHEIWTASYIDFNGEFQQGKRYLFINLELISEEDNPYDDIPYIIKYSGYGREAYEGKPEYKSVGFYTRQNKSMMLAEMRRFTHLDAIMSQLAFPVAFMNQSAEMFNISFAPGAINYVPASAMENIDKLWVQPRIPNQEYTQSLGAIGAQIERGTVQRAVRGAGVPGTDSAAQYSLIATAAHLRLDSCIQSTEQAMSIVSERALKYIDLTFEKPVSIFGAENRTEKYVLAPKNIKGRYTIDIKFQPNEDAIKERKLLLANEAISKGRMSRYDAYVFAGFENPSEMVARSLAYMAMEDPLIIRFLAKESLRDWGLDADKIEMEERILDMQKQFALKQIMEEMQLGTARGIGDPTQPGGSPPGGTPPGPQGLAPPGAMPVGAPPITTGPMPVPQMIQQTSQMPIQ